MSSAECWSTVYARNEIGRGRQSCCKMQAHSADDADDMSLHADVAGRTLVPRSSEAISSRVLICTVHVAAKSARRQWHVVSAKRCKHRIMTCLL